MTDVRKLYAKSETSQSIKVKGESNMEKTKLNLTEAEKHRINKGKAMQEFIHNEARYFAVLESLERILLHKFTTDVSFVILNKVATGESLSEEEIGYVVNEIGLDREIIDFFIYMVNLLKMKAHKFARNLPKEISDEVEVDLIGYIDLIQYDKNNVEL